MKFVIFLIFFKLKMEETLGGCSWYILLFLSNI